MAKKLDRIRFVIKVGPALGLMGTLIPMGISLAALAEGNIQKWQAAWLPHLRQQWLAWAVVLWRI